RDYKVTGVQTCALPILTFSHTASRTPLIVENGRGLENVTRVAVQRFQPRLNLLVGHSCPTGMSDWLVRLTARMNIESCFSRALRSEERRVGKECRSVCA